MAGAFSAGDNAPAAAKFQSVLEGKMYEDMGIAAVAAPLLIGTLVGGAVGLIILFITVI